MAFLKPQQSAQSAEILALVVDQLRVLAKGLEAILPDRHLQLGYCFGIKEVILAFATPLVLSTHIQQRIVGPSFGVSLVVA